MTLRHLIIRIGLGATVHTRNHVYCDINSLLNTIKLYDSQDTFINILYHLYSVPFLVNTPFCKIKGNRLLAVALNSSSVFRDPACSFNQDTVDAQIFPPLSLGICPQARFEGVTKRQLIYLPTKESHLTFTPAQIKSPLGWNYILIWYNNKFPFFHTPDCSPR